MKYKLLIMLEKIVPFNINIYSQPGFFYTTLPSCYHDEIFTFITYVCVAINLLQLTGYVMHQQV
jgi:hypothetical protein